MAADGYEHDACVVPGAHKSLVQNQCHALDWQPYPCQHQCSATGINHLLGGSEQAKHGAGEADHGNGQNGHEGCGHDDDVDTPAVGVI